jgi:hypothetical protein
MTSLSQRNWQSGRKASRGCDEESRFPRRVSNQGETTMPKSLEAITETIRNPKHPFRQVDDRPGKPKKHRYERRKIREFIRYGDWSEELAT